MKILVYIIAAVLGVLAGALIMRGALSPKMAALTNDAAQLQSRNQELETQVTKLMKHGEQLEQQLARIKQPAPEAETPPVPETDELQASLEDTEASDELAAPQHDSRRDFRRRGSARVIGAEGEGEGEGEQERAALEERLARFREFQQQVTDRVAAVLQDEMTNATDAASQERIQNIQTYVDQLAQLRSDMRNAETDEERDTLRQTMFETYGELQGLVQTQQDSMLRSFAANNGITDATKQDAFISGLHDLQSTPFFQADRMMGGGGRGGRGGFGGFGGFGGPGRPGGGGFGGGTPDAGNRQR